jgi:predicted RNase H-like HicB family nuclease
VTPHYHINLFWSDEDDAWIADVPDLRFCSAHGDTPEGALAEIQTAMAAWLGTASERGLAIPEAKYRPAPASRAA